MLNKVALRYKAVFVDVDRSVGYGVAFSPSAEVLALLHSLAECGYAVEEELLHALCAVSVDTLEEISKVMGEAYGMELNWMPLVKGWDVPTGENALDHFITFLANKPGIRENVQGTPLPCGHLIPQGTFPMERYNGCPYCGTPFQTADFVCKGQGSKLKVLSLFTMEDMNRLLRRLLTSPVPLDATQMDSLKCLAEVLDIPAGVTPKVKEICMVMIAAQLKKGHTEAVAEYMQSPADILRFLWFEKTGKAIIVRPKSMMHTAFKWIGVLGEGPYKSKTDIREKMKAHLRLKYDRKTCRIVAGWLNDLPMDAKKAAEQMHPYRRMWVRFIRALRLAEYAKKPGFAHLSELMDVFYRQDYKVWMGEVNEATSANNKEKTLRMLSARPGLFARSLFATMLRFGAECTLAAFRSVAQNVPSRLILSLVNAAEAYFNPQAVRYASPVTGTKVKIAPNKMLAHYFMDELAEMKRLVNKLFMDVMSDKFAGTERSSKTMYIDPLLFDVPVAVGDRASTVQDASCALPGTRFKVEGDAVRLFLQWGKGLSAQHMDMDLSCWILYDNKAVVCAFHHLVTTGAKHSGDIRSIPEKVGTAEYIELDISTLRSAEAKYAIFMCNAYSAGRLSPNLQVGWMNAASPMMISAETGVAYDPSCVQHMVRVGDDNLSKGMTFGILDVTEGVITWLELANQEQAAFRVDIQGVTDYLTKLRQKCSIGQLLAIKARAQGMTLVPDANTAEEVYTYAWALSPGAVSTLLG